MFKEQYLLDLLSGELTEKGYANILGSISALVRKNQWQKSIIVSKDTNKDWTDEDIKELAHMYFEWVIVHDKLKYLRKVPFEYLSYYFTQMLVSFVANKIKEEQQKIGISFQKCQELVRQICEEEYGLNIINGQNFVKSSFANSDKMANDLYDLIKYMPHFPIDENTRQFKPTVKMVVDDILVNADCFVSVECLCKATFALLDQTHLIVSTTNNVEPEEIDESFKYKDAINNILSGICKSDIALFLEYIFQETGKVSLSEVALKYGIPKSSAHKKIEDFKKKIFTYYIPENEADGISFLQNLTISMDDFSK